MIYFVLFDLRHLQTVRDAVIMGYLDCDKDTDMKFFKRQLQLAASVPIHSTMFWIHEFDWRQICTNHIQSNKIHHNRIKKMFATSVNTYSTVYKWSVNVNIKSTTKFLHVVLVLVPDVLMCQFGNKHPRVSNDGWHSWSWQHDICSRELGLAQSQPPLKSQHYSSVKCRSLSIYFMFLFNKR